MNAKSQPWLDEPDRLEFESHGYPCLIVRGPVGSLCGYVGVSKGHPAFEKHYDNFQNLDVHGGLTYADHCQGKVCHTPKEGETDDIWWLGFDCAHLDDISPGLMTHYGTEWPYFEGHKPKYRTIAYVKRECKKLAMQLVGVAKCYPSA